MDISLIKLNSEPNDKRFSFKTFEPLPIKKSLNQNQNNSFLLMDNLKIIFQLFPLRRELIIFFNNSLFSLFFFLLFLKILFFLLQLFYNLSLKFLLYLL